ncbi:hypothetical protein [Burkholderia contaminans]|nr:hypothetical protein [Burkholderia contaminans]
MFDINALRLTWGMPFLADLPDTETHVSADRPRFRAYLVNVQLLPGWYMIELRVNGQAAMVRARLRLHARSSFTTLAMELSSQQLSKRLIRLPERGRIEIEIDLDDRSVDRVEMFRLIRVTKRFARSRIMAKLESLHPKYKPCGEDYDLADIFHSCADMEQAWRDYCCLFDESELVGYPDWVRHFDTPSSDTYRVMKDNLRHFATCPVFAIGMEVSDVPSPHLEAAIRSVSAQIYPHWKLLVVDRRSSSDSSELIPRDLRADSRIRVISGQSSTETHSTLDRKLAESGSWVVFLGQRDVLPQHGLYVVADSINRRLSRGGVKEPGMGGVMAPAEPGVKRGFERFQGCGFLPFLATAF